MSVKARDLENPERGMDLSTREAGEEKRKDPAVAELRLLRERIAAVRATPPVDPIPHCRDCYNRGVRAALHEIDGS